jgi:acetylornithine deacetylase/succinyl-diaminopimelate desuccinylase-like protein
MAAAVPPPDDGALQEALDAITLDDAVALTRGLIDVPSPTGQERECALYLQDYLRAAGIEVRLQELEAGRANVIAAVRGAGDGPTLMLNGHLDTTQYGDEAEDYAILGEPRPNDRPRSFELDGGIYGLGAFNMKGGVAAIFLALRALAQAGVRLPGHVLASGVSGESEKAPVRGAHRTYDGPRYRGGGYGTRSLLMHCDPIDYAIVAEPSDLYVANAQAGYLFVKVVVRGRSSYLSSRGSQGSAPGISALDEAVEIVRALGAWGDEYAARHVYDTGMGVITPMVTVGAIDSGWPFFPSIVPGICHLYVNLRLTPALTGTQALAELDAHLRGQVAGRPGLSYGLEVYASNQPSTVTPADSLLCRTAVEIMEQRLGLPTRPFGPGEADPSNDTNVFRRHGVPAIKCGPKTRLEANAAAMLRQHGPHVYRDDVVVAARFYVHMAFALCGRTRAALESSSP